jgi:hypothetical protein
MISELFVQRAILPCGRAWSCCLKSRRAEAAKGKIAFLKDFPAEP